MQKEHVSQPLQAEIDEIAALGSSFPLTLDVSQHMIDGDAARIAPKTKSWQAIAAAGNVPELVVRAERMYAIALDAHAQGGEENIKFFRRYTSFIEALGTGLLEPFSSTPLRQYIRDSDPDAQIKRGVLDALDLLSTRYAGRVPALLWEALAFVALRDDAFIDRSIIGDALKYKGSVARWHYAFYDACLHGIGKVYSLLLDAQTDICRESGVVLIHNCDCGCSLVRLSRNGTVNVPLAPEFHKKAAESFLTHVLTEGIVLLRDRLPFVTGVGDDAAAALALEAQGLL